QREFGPVRLWGTIGWIAAAWPFTFIMIDWARVPPLESMIGDTDPSLLDSAAVFFAWLERALGLSKKGADFNLATSYTFLAAGLACLSLAAISAFLPHTPPRRAEQAQEKLAWLEAMKLLRKPFVLVLFVVTFLDAAVHQFFFAWTARYLTDGVGIPGNWVMPVMSISQIAEIGTMAFLGYVLKRLGWRLTMVIGVLGHAGRFTVFALYPEPWAAVTINVLHGICYAFFF